MLGPNHRDPYNGHKSQVGEQLIDVVFKELTAEECIKLAIQKINAETVTEQSARAKAMVLTKLDEAEMWNWKFLQRGKK
jgi:hypothetical protein